MVPTMAPQTRSQTANAKAKAAEQPAEKAPELEETPLPELVVQDMDKEQIWAQLELRAQNVSRVLEYALESTGELPESDDEKGEGAADTHMLCVSLRMVKLKQHRTLIPWSSLPIFFTGPLPSPPAAPSSPSSFFASPFGPSFSFSSRAEPGVGGGGPGLFNKHPVKMAFCELSKDVDVGVAIRSKQPEESMERTE